MRKLPGVLWAFATRVMAARKEVSKVTPSQLGYSVEVSLSRLDIYDHLSPLNQALLTGAKRVQQAKALNSAVNLFSQTSSVHDYNPRSSFTNNMYIKKFNLEKLRQAVPIFGTKVWNEIPGRMRDMSKKVFKRKLISVLFKILKDKDDNLDATMITQEIKLQNPKP